ncbi:MAG TPA: ATP-binding protein [Polyangiaceae bacterium]|nr:ATP-binding protein [Polyangiaceae bacterium]
MDDDLQQLLINLKLKKILEILPRHLERAEKEGSSYTELLSRLLREEYQEREMRFLGHRIRRARLPEPWTLESFPWDRQPGVKRAVIEELALLSFIERASNIVFIGETGTGKTGLSIGLLRKALERGKRGLFMKAQDLFDDMYASLADRSSRKLLNRLAKLDLLVIDEMGYLNLRPEQSNIFFKLMEERYGRKATIITTNLKYEDWYGFLGQKEMVGALLDRLRHRCTTIEINGPSLRGPE